MIVLWIAVAVALAGLALFAWPRRVELALQARGTADGAWAIAGGAQFLGCTASVAGARGVPPTVALHVPLRKRPVARWSAGNPPKPRRPRPKDAPPEKSVVERARIWSRRVNPLELLSFAKGEVERLGVRDVKGEVCVGLADPALAGQVAGALYVVEALVAPFGSLRHELDWSGREHLDADVSLALRFSPLLVALDCARFALRLARLRLFPPKSTPPAPALDAHP